MSVILCEKLDRGYLPAYDEVCDWKATTLSKLRYIQIKIIHKI